MGSSLALELVRNAVGAADDHHADSLLHRVYLWLVARRNSGCERATDAAIIATTLLRDNVIRRTVGLFVFTLLFALGTVARSRRPFPVSSCGCRRSLGLARSWPFFFSSTMPPDCCAQSASYGAWARRASRSSRACTRSRSGTPTRPPRRPQLGSPDRIVSHRGTPAIVLAVNLEALVAEASRVEGVIEVVPRVGDFVAVGEPVFLLYGGSGAFDERKLRGSIAFGPERTIEQDSTFAVRVIVDIAIRALSKAINDPTTAVLAIDQLHRCFETSAGGICTTSKSWTTSGACGWFSRRRIGTISYSLLFGKFAFTAPRTFRLRDACAP